MRIYLAFPGRANAAITGSSIWLAHIHATLVGMGHDVVRFDEEFAHLLTDGLPADERDAARAHLSERLRAHVRECHALRPIDLFLSYFYTTCVEPDVVHEIRRMGIPTVNFSCNNTHQFHTVRDLAPHYDYCMVPERQALASFRKVGARAVHVQMGANPRFFKPLDAPKLYPVTFIGTKYADRLRFITALAAGRVGVHVWGVGWKRESVVEMATGGRRALRLGGVPRLIRGATNRLREWGVTRTVDRCASPPVPDEEMVRIYNQSMIALNFSKAPDDRNPAVYYRPIRLRDFEVPMIGVFYMPEFSDEISEYYDVGAEVVTFESPQELVDKARYYLAHDTERDTIGRAGYRRAVSEHTWAHRFHKLFREVGVR